jgi:hypothetical protein
MNGRAPDQGTATVPATAAVFAYEAGEQLPLLPELEPLPQAPKRGTHPHRLLAMFAQGCALDHPAYIDRTGSWRLAAHAHELVKLGWPVLSVDVPAPTDTCPSRHISVYTLAQRGRAIAAEVVQ